MWGSGTDLSEGRGVWDGANDSLCQPLNCCGRVSLRICCGCHRVWAARPASKPSLRSLTQLMAAVVPTSSLKHDADELRQQQGYCAAVAAGPEDGSYLPYGL